MCRISILRTVQPYGNHLARSQRDSQTPFVTPHGRDLTIDDQYPVHRSITGCHGANAIRKSKRFRFRSKRPYPTIRLRRRIRENRIHVDARVKCPAAGQKFHDTNFKPQHHVDPMAIFTNVEWEGKPLDTKVDFHLYGTDHRFGETFDLKMLMGRWWTEGNELSVVLNESAVRAMGLQDPVGSIIRMPWWSDFSVIKEYEIVGVVNDFHALSFRESIHPMLFIPSGGLVNNLYIRVVAGEEGNVTHRITELLPKIDPTLADTQLTPIGTLYDQLNQSEIVGLKIFSFLAFACLLISLFGIYAVATASTKRRRKEIAIRKVVGSKASEIIFLFFKEYMRLIVIAGIIAFPISYLVMNYWLQGYAYRIQIQIWWLVGIFITITSMVLGTIREQVCKAANENPSEVIKSQ